MSVQEHRLLRTVSFVILLLLVAFAIVALVLMGMHPVMPKTADYIMPAQIVAGYALPLP